MKCDQCDNEATVHEVVVHQGKKVEKHLCEQCAKQHGVVAPAHTSINSLVSKFVISGPTSKQATQRVVCQGCNMSFAEFRQHGLLGCPACYGAFEEQLESLIERAQEGASHHVGKSPSRAGGSVDRQRRIASLRRALNDAVTSEEYERAAQIRDEMSALTLPSGEIDDPEAEEIG